MKPFSRTCQVCLEYSPVVYNIFSGEDAIHDARLALKELVPDINLEENKALFFCNSCCTELKRQQAFKDMVYKNLLLIRDKYETNPPGNSISVSETNSDVTPKTDEERWNRINAQVLEILRKEKVISSEKEDIIGNTKKFYSEPFYENLSPHFENRGMPSGLFNRYVDQPVCETIIQEQGPQIRNESTTFNTGEKLIWVNGPNASGFKGQQSYEDVSDDSLDQVIDLTVDSKSVKGNTEFENRASGSELFAFPEYFYNSEETNSLNSERLDEHLSVGIGRGAEIGLGVTENLADIIAKKNAGMDNSDSDIQFVTCDDNSSQSNFVIQISDSASASCLSDTDNEGNGGHQQKSETFMDVTSDSYVRQIPASTTTNYKMSETTGHVTAIKHDSSQLLVTKKQHWYKKIKYTRHAGYDYYSKDEKIHICDICQKSFEHPRSLELHKRSHTAKNKMYTCTECNSSFSAQCNFLEHLRTHLTTGSDYVCGVCDANFTDRRELTAHKRAHNSNETYVCNNCQESFSTSRAVYKHKSEFVCLKSKFLQQ